MQELIFQDSCFDLSDSKQYKISIQASLDGFSLLIQHPEQGQVHLAYYIPFTLSSCSGLVRKVREIIEKLGLTGKTFHSVTVYLSDRLVKLIPVELYSEKTVRRTLALQSPGLKKMTASGMKLNDHYFLAFSVDSALLDYFSDQFRGCTIKHESHPLLSYLVKNSPDGSRIMHIHFHAGHFFVSLAGNNQIHFFNSFEYQTPEDALFYLASTMQVTGTNETRVLFSGNLREDSILYKQLIKFFPEASLFSTDPELFQGTGWDNDILRFLLPVILDQS